MVKLYRQLPSVIMGIRDDYTAYCLNEAVAYIDAKIVKPKAIRYLAVTDADRR